MMMFSFLFQLISLSCCNNVSTFSPIIVCICISSVFVSQTIELERTRALQKKPGRVGRNVQDFYVGSIIGAREEIFPRKIIRHDFHDY